MLTECTVDSTVQTLDPESTTVTTGDNPSEDGITPLVIGQQYLDVVFVEGPHASYNFDLLIVQNFSDNPPMYFGQPMIVYQDANGFRALFNASPDSDFYELRWRITF